MKVAMEVLQVVTVVCRDENIDTLTAGYLRRPRQLA